MSLTPGLQQLDLWPRHCEGARGRTASHFGSLMKSALEETVRLTRRSKLEGIMAGQASLV